MRSILPLLLVSGPLPLSVAHEHSDCHHGIHADPDREGYSPQRYASHHPMIRRALSQSSFSPIRVHTVINSIDALDAAHQSFLLNDLLPKATGWLQQTLRVEPVISPLLFARNCTAYYATTPPTCGALADSLCGVAADGGAAVVPPELQEELRVCSSCFGAGCSTGSDCTTYPAGQGASDADFVLFVSSVQASNCGSSTLAYASTCQRDQFDRPILGHVNFCPARVSTEASSWELQLATAIHELLHAIGFTYSSWPLFRYPDGTPRTPRDADGRVPRTAQYVCPDGSVATNVQVPSNNTIEIATERGVTVTRMVTPKVASVARDLFGCDSLSGAELENQPTTSGACWGSHWEQRLFSSDLMTAVTTHLSKYSALSLAALEDSGWYVANYSLVDPLIWGRLQGCDFVTQKCVDNGVALQTANPTFCTVQNEFQCTIDHKAKATCNLYDFGSPLPAAFQYFSDPNLGGTVATYDYCPFYRGASNGDCDDTSNAPSTNYRAETLGSGSYCTTSTLSQPIGGFQLSQPVSSRPTCHVSRCFGASLLQFQIQASDGSLHWLNCTSGGAYVTPPPSLGISGSLLCPTSLWHICDASRCPERCSSTADESLCYGGVCTCGDSWDSACNTLLPPPPSPPDTPPPPSSPPPSLPPPVVEVLLTFSLNTTEAKLDQPALIANLRAAIGCTPATCQIKLTFSPAVSGRRLSLRALPSLAARRRLAQLDVTAQVLLIGATQLSDPLVVAAQALASDTAAQLEAKLGVRVLSVAPARTTVFSSFSIVVAPPPPVPLAPSPLAPPPKESSGLDTTVLIIIIAAGAAAVVLVGIVCICRKQRAPAKAPANAAPSSQAATSTSRNRGEPSADADAKVEYL
ncbi:hypothetical protein AB1Y20_003895 [Prymnesium parvum]|uniref:Leishmanolysin-like peptidase n=1 Tax=Prymnesium parvum TaxID=97485 RepID=A0AB34J8A4_PRYPA